MSYQHWTVAGEKESGQLIGFQSFGEWLYMHTLWSVLTALSVWGELGGDNIILEDGSNRGVDGRWREELGGRYILFHTCVKFSKLKSTY